jgi:phage anti-repressor protein
MVDARALHKLLGVKTKFADWIKRRLKDPHVQDCDYTAILIGENGNNAFKEYKITTFLAEHFAMSENTPESFEIRNFYIKCRLAVGLLKAELEKVRGERDILLKPKRVRDGGVTYVSVPHKVTEIDMFGLSHTFYRNVRVPLDAASEAELMDYRNKHRDKVIAGIVQNQIKDNDKSVVIPFERRLKAGKDEE